MDGADYSRASHAVWEAMALLTQLGLEKDAAAVRVPSHRIGPPETLTAVQYGNLIRAAAARACAASDILHRRRRTLEPRDHQAACWPCRHPYLVGCACNDN